MTRGKFRVRGDTLEVYPAYEETVARVEYFGDEVERILTMNPVTGEVIEELNELFIFPASHFVGHKEHSNSFTHEVSPSMCAMRVPFGSILNRCGNSGLAASTISCVER